MASILPTVPRFVFTVFEPLSLLVGFIGACTGPDWFIGEQIAIAAAETYSPNSIVVALQLGNLYLLLAMIGIAVLYTTTEPQVVRNYIWALLIADLGHLYFTYCVLEYSRFVDIANWNAMAYGNILFTVCLYPARDQIDTDNVAQALLFLTRVGYLAGIFGPNKDPGNAASAKKLS